MIQPIPVGSRVPETTLQHLGPSGLAHLSTAALFAGKKVVLFGLPGAFTPTCSSAHVPRYEQLADAFAAVGVDDILCVSVNDAFVMSAWAQDQDVHRVRLLGDGNGAFTEGLGLLVDKSDLGFGKRAWRFAAVVDDGVITQWFVEPVKPGDPYEVSDADTVLRALGGEAPPEVLLFTKPGCGHCARAKAALAEAGLPWAELPTSPRILKALPGAGTTPQVFVNGRHVGGADELVAWLATR
jgi:peroxiredoxin/glutaredoxin